MKNIFLARKRRLGKYFSLTKFRSPGECSSFVKKVGRVNETKYRRLEESFTLVKNRRIGQCSSLTEHRKKDWVKVPSLAKNTCIFILNEKQKDLWIFLISEEKMNGRMFIFSDDQKELVTVPPDGDGVIGKDSSLVQNRRIGECYSSVLKRMVS